MLLSCSPNSAFLTQFNKGSYMAAMNIRCFNRHISVASQPLRPVPLPHPMEAHMWYVIPDEVKGSSLLDQYLEILSPSEKQSVLSLKDDELRKRAVLARTLVRTTIARYQTNPRIDPRSLSFKKNSYGKPEVDSQFASGCSPPPLHFNLSHTSSLIACGITAHSPIGIDVEKKKRIIKNDVMSFARRFFCQHEVEHLANISDHGKRRQEFIKLWTLKVPEIVESTYIAHKWQFALLELADTHYAAICMEKNTGFQETEESPMMLRVWKTIPFLEDLCVSGTPSVATVGGLVKQLESFC